MTLPKELNYFHIIQVVLLTSKDKSKKLYEYLSRKSREAYKDPLLIANAVLSKQETRGRILEIYLAGKNPPKITKFFIWKALFCYAIKNLLSFLLCVFTAFLHRISGQKFSVKESGELIIIDTFLLASNILKNDRLEDLFLRNISQYLINKKKVCAYVPKFDSIHPFNLFRIFKLLKKERIPTLIPFQLLNSKDYIEAIQFLFLYPFSCYRFIKSLGNSYEDEVLRYGLWATFDGIVLNFYTRFLFGKRLASMKFEKIKCIAWYENQVFDKMFYRGLNSVPNKTEIIGAQLYLREHHLINTTPDIDEISFNVIPNKVLVNGPAYLFELGKIKVQVGPSLRYQHIYETSHQASQGEYILIVTPYWDHVTDSLLKVIREVDWKTPVKIKFHPTKDWKKFAALIPNQFRVTEEPISELLANARIVLGRSSGAQVEAVACGIPVIDIDDPNIFSHSHMPEEGKGILWDRATNAKEVNTLLMHFENLLESNPGLLREEGLRIKALYFSEPTAEHIDQAFELN